MQIISGAVGAERVHFEAPPSKRVPAEMKRFIAWFKRTGPGDKEPLPAITRAGTAHLYFESIHPFEDGNGRIGRAIAEKAMTQSFGQPVVLALASAILAHQKDYYAALEKANRQNEITEWLAWFSRIGTRRDPPSSPRRPAPPGSGAVDLSPNRAASESRTVRWLD